MEFYKKLCAGISFWIALASAWESTSSLQKKLRAGISFWIALGSAWGRFGLGVEQA